MTPKYTKLEAATRIEIDQKLEQAGWVVQDKGRLNLFAALGVAVREMDTDTGPADYMLFLEGKACGIIEAKREGANLGEVFSQSRRYATSNSKHIERWMERLPFTYEATNHEIRFCDWRDPYTRSRNIYFFHRPETLLTWVQQENTLRTRLQRLPELNKTGLRDCQIEAIEGIETSLKQGKPRSLLQMATGSGKTYAAVTEIYRLAKYAKVQRVLFLVDRGNLGRQALKEFQQYTVPDDQRKFTELYNVHILGAADIGDEIKVTISTIQRLYSKLTNKELLEDVEEHSGYEVDGYSSNEKPREVSYNPAIPVEAFDLIIIDECHRSIYNLWRQVLEYFDAFLIGLTATPTKKTIGFFNQNMVSEYTHEDAVIDQVNVGYDVYSIRTKKTMEGDVIEAGTTVQVRDRLTKQERYQVLDQEEEYSVQQIDRSIIAPNQIRTIIQTFKERVFKDIFPNRSGEWLPKTLIFAKDDDHADRIVKTVLEEFGESNAFCKKVTYKVGKKTAEDTIAELRTNPRLRIGVTVDMIATGTDIRPLEIVMFMRDVKSPGYYEQMKGRGTRVIGEDELRRVTPDAKQKTRFVLIDCVGVTESDKTESKSLESKPSVPTDKLMLQIARGDRHSDSLRTLGNRLLRLDMKLNPQQRNHIKQLILKVAPAQSTGVLPKEYQPPTSILAVAANLIHATKDENLVKLAQAETGKDEVTDQDIQHAFKSQADLLIQVFHDPDLRDLLEDYRRDTDQIFDDSADELIQDKVGFTKERAENLIKNWAQFIQDHKDELDAIQLIYQQPYQKRHLSYEQIEKLAEEIQQPPYNLAPIEVWKAYEQLEKNKVKGVPPKELLTNIVSLIRFSTGLSDVLEPFTELVNNRFDNWLKQQNKAFQPDQLAWLNKIKDQIAQNAEMTVDDFNYIPFNQEGGLLKARELFGKDLDYLIQELNGYLIA
ncbi:MAG: DEAD/DEAH box helicase family protein [Gammaproteobacteria bacterium]|nr:DEAD/DEAH box helicase family protein [Gammaproteobacteria bacterium]MDH5802816.1 DEAD/DEAH box helicase family protein [Gammaproteobacteria bacterium]